MSTTNRFWSSITRSLLGLGLALALTGCGGDESGENPSSFRIAKAVVKNLLANSVEVKKIEGAEGAETVEPAPANRPQAMPAPPPAYEFAEAELPQTCDIPFNGSVTIVPIRSANALQQSIARRPSRELVYETDDTAIFEDGYVMTTQIENVGTHLNAVGWSTNPMQILGAGVRPGGSSANAGWRAADGKTKKKKRRRRG